LAVLKAEAKACDKKLAEERAAEEAAERKVAQDAADTRRAQDVARHIVSNEDGSFNFESLDHFFDALWRRGGD
jgi:multidrug resistance efflux pump